MTHISPMMQNLAGIPRTKQLRVAHHQAAIARNQASIFQCAEDTQSMLVSLGQGNTGSCRDIISAQVARGQFQGEGGVAAANSRAVLESFFKNPDAFTNEASLSVFLKVSMRAGSTIFRDEKDLRAFMDALARDEHKISGRILVEQIGKYQFGDFFGAVSQKSMALAEKLMEASARAASPRDIQEIRQDLARFLVHEAQGPSFVIKNEFQGKTGSPGHTKKFMESAAPDMLNAVPVPSSPLDVHPAARSAGSCRTAEPVLAITG